MEIISERKIKNENNTISTLSINGKVFCDVLEDVERLTWTGSGIARKLLGTKVFGKTAIPKGRYKVIMAYSPRFKRELPLLLNVPQFVGILIHSGNTELDTEGCLIVGKYDPKKKMIAYGTSRSKSDELNAIIKKACAKEEVYITVK